MLKEIRCRNCSRVLCKVDADGTIHARTRKDGIEIITKIDFGKVHIICNSIYDPITDKKLLKPCRTTEILEYA